MQRVFEVQPAKFFAECGGQHCAFEFVTRQRFFDQCRGQHQQATGGVHQRVFQRGVQVQRLVGWDGPCGRRPDDNKRGFVQRGQAKRGGQLGRLVRFKSHVDGLGFLVRVFDLELGQRRAAVETPVHRLQTAVDEAAFHDALERTDLVGLVAGVHREVRVVPFTQHAQALEVLLLLCDLLGGVGAALGLHFVTAQVAAMGFFDLVLDRQAVAVPARHIDGVHALELARLDDHVLQDLVDRVAHVDLAVGVGRAVVQHELWSTGAHVAQLFVDALVVPFLDPARLTLGQVATHGEGGVGQVQGAAVVGLGGVCRLGHGNSGPSLRGSGHRNREGNTGRARQAAPGCVLDGKVCRAGFSPSKFGRGWSGGGFAHAGTHPRQKTHVRLRSPSRCRWSTRPGWCTSVRHAVCAAVPRG